MQHKHVASILAFILASAAPAFADAFPGHATGGNKYVTFSEGFTSQQNSQGGAAECNFLIGVRGENGLSASSIVGASSSAPGASGESVKFVDFTGNQGASSASSDKDKGKGKGKGKPSGGSGVGNGSGGGEGETGSVVLVAEPGSQSLLLFGLGGLGMLFFRRKTLPSAI